VWEGSGTGDPRWLHADERGSIVAGSSSGGASLFTNGYGPFGEPGKVLNGRFGYTSQVRLPEIGLYYYKARYYSPHLGRFIETDPIETADNQNLYGYVANDPVNLTDPTGTQAAPATPQPPPPSIPDIVVTGSRWVFDNTFGPGTLYDRAIVVPFYSGLDLLERSGIADEGFWMAVQQAGPPVTKPVGALGRAGAAALKLINRTARIVRGGGATNSAARIERAGRGVANWLGRGYTFRTTPTGNKIFQSADTQRRFRIDFTQSGRGEFRGPHGQFEIRDSRGNFQPAPGVDQHIYFGGK
jgi:RHS repeat-associated protein